METKKGEQKGPETEIKFAKVGNAYLNTRGIERFLVIDEDIFITMHKGGEHALICDLGHDEDSIMINAVRRLHEKAHDIIYLEKSSQHGEHMEEDASSNLLYRRWLETRETHNIPHEDGHVQAHVEEPLHKRLLRKTHK